MARPRRAVTTSAGPGTGPPDSSTRLSAGGAFFLHAVFIVGLLVLSQLPVLDPRPAVRTSIVGAAVVLLAWSALLFGVLLRGQTVTLEVGLRRQHYLQACQQSVVLLVWGYYWREVYPARQQGADPGSGARTALRARLRVGVAGHLRASIDRCAEPQRPRNSRSRPHKV